MLVSGLSSGGVTLGAGVTVSVIGSTTQAVSNVGNFLGDCPPGYEQEEG